MMQDRRRKQRPPHLGGSLNITLANVTLWGPSVREGLKQSVEGSAIVLLGQAAVCGEACILRGA